MVANGQYMMSAGVGDGYLNCQVSDNVYTIPVSDVLHVGLPTFETDLLSVKSVKKLTKQGHTVQFEGDICRISRGNKTYAEGEITNNLYQLACDKAHIANQGSHRNCIHQWHRRLGHRDPEEVLKLNQQKLADGIIIKDCETRLKCISCIKGKMTRKSFPKCSSHRANNLLDVTHTDVCGPMNTETPGRKRYFLTFIDD